MAKDSRETRIEFTVVHHGLEFVRVANIWLSTDMHGRPILEISVSGGYIKPYSRVWKNWGLNDLPSAAHYSLKYNELVARYTKKKGAKQIK